MRINLSTVLIWLLIVYLSGCLFFSFKINWTDVPEERAKIFSQRSVFFVLEDYDHKIWLSNPAEHDYFAMKAWWRIK